MGKYDEAVAAYSKLQEDDDSPAPHQGLQYLKTTRSANLEFLRGNVQESIQHIAPSRRHGNRSARCRTKASLGHSLLWARSFFRRAI